MSLFNLKNKSFLITGSSKGIGKSIAFHAASHGAKVIISSRKIDTCKKTADEINEQVGSELAFPIAGNIAHESELISLVDETNKLLGKIDVLICNAATNPFMGSMADIPSDAFDKVLADGSYTQGALVIKDSKLVYERYRGIAVNEEKVLKDKNWEGYSTNIQGRLGARDKNSLVTSWSTAKSFTSIVAAIAIEQGYINSLEQSASDFMSEWANDSRKQITIRDLLDMHSGLTMACASNSNGEWILVGNCETSKRDNGILYFDDMLDVCINREMAQTGVDYPWFNDYGSGELWQPGDYVYMNCDTMVMGEVLFRATGKNIETYADLNLFSKIGMDAEWWQDIDGNYLAFCCIDATVRDFAKFGQVILNNGVLDGEQIIPKSYIEKIKNIPSEEKPDNWNIRYPNNSYALNFWTLEPGITDNDTTFPAVDTIFHTLGFDEQMIMIDFTNNMLVLRFSLYELSLNYNVERKYKDNDQYATSNYILSLPGGIGLGGIQNYKPYDFLYDVTQSIDLN